MHKRSIRLVVRSCCGLFSRQSDGTGAHSEVSVIRVVDKLSKQAGRIRCKAALRQRRE